MRRTGRRGWERWAAPAVAAGLLAGCTAAPSGGPAEEEADAAAPIPAECEKEAEHPKRQMRGAWLTTVRNLDWPSSDDLSAEEQKEELRERLDGAAALGLNTVFFQARPTADAVYASEKEPWARYLTGKQGGDPGYDPLEFAVDEAHARGLELHAWFNPYRVGWKDPDLEGLTADHPAEKHPEWLITYDDQGWLDPGNPEVQEWVSDVVLDVVDRYDVDGVHFDDYFYPYPAEGEGDFEDDDSWEAHGDGFDDRGDWRRANVDALLADIHGRIGETKPWVRFGVSPFGIYRNAGSDPSGSDTKGLESYSAQYADTRSWIEQGSVDYLVPQIYWERGFGTADYEELVPWWAEEVEGTGVDLYIGQAAYRVGEDGWKGEDALARQLDFNLEHPQVGGDVYYGMRDVLGKAEKAMERLGEDHYAAPALPPAAGGGAGPPDPPARVTAERNGSGGVDVDWEPVEGARSYAVYRLPADAPDDPCELAGRDRLVGVAGSPGLTDGTAGSGEYRYHVTALDRYRDESAPGGGAEVPEGGAAAE
ncbi:family 10 glycosylhydrolase [Nocardiopsis sp. CNT-189]|uniref:glycoside hydrolase family 10 protein n=1 Tax=Nocardiopsis oceanisediminis TaxID=2816862 RepID=UPI003B2EDA2A